MQDNNQINKFRASSFGGVLAVYLGRETCGSNRYVSYKIRGLSGKGVEMFSNTAQKVSSIFAAVGLVLGLDSCASTPIHVEKRTAPTPTGSEFQSLAFTFPKVGTYHVEVDVARWVGIDEAVGYTALDTNLVVSSPGTTFLLDADIISEINRGVGHSIRVAEVRSTDKAQLLFADDSY